MERFYDRGSGHMAVSVLGGRDKGDVMDADLAPNFLQQSATRQN